MGAHAPAVYFDLDGFAHADLFAAAADVWEALGSLPGYLRARVPASGNDIRGTVHQGSFVASDGVVIGEGTVVEPGAYIAGPTIIGKGCEVRHGAYIRGEVIVGDGCVVGHTTEVKTSVFLDGAKAGHFAYIGDSILGNGVNLGAGTKLANFKLTGDEIVLRLADGRRPTGRRKLGAILGDGCQTGCNSVTSPGTLLGRGSFVYPCVSVRAGAYDAGCRLSSHGS
ncbi:MAG: hypothetical protein U0166_25700 [Acidobacteriota bacterium]